jgi:thiopurine S-methyltransferase
MNDNEIYWTKRYKDESLGWDIGQPSTPLIEYFDQLKDKSIKVLIPGAGNAYEAEYLDAIGFKNIHILDISETPIKLFAARNPDFPSDHIHHQDFFKHKGTYDLIIEQTFFCSFVPEKMNRAKYATKMASLLAPKGKLVGLWFDFPLTDDLEKRPFGGTKTEYEGYLNPYFEVITFEKAYNSIEARKESELFGIFQKREKKTTQKNNPLHGITLKAMLEHLIETYGWYDLGERIKINSFVTNPSINSSLKFLRRTPWARERVEQLYLKSLRDK